ncbi:MAG: diadenylate cyclase CdaA [Candidatus Sericytochromatia bacterium]
MESLQGLTQWIAHFVTSLRWQDFLDVALVSFVFYRLFSFVKETRAAHLIRGVLLLVIIYFIANTFLELRILTSVLQNAATLVIVAIPVVFQPELRKALSELGRGVSLFPGERLKGKELFGVTNTLVNAVQEMSENRTGALIVIERQIGLSEYSSDGYPVDAQVSKELLLTIFHDGTPMHDGAVVLRGDRLVAAGVVLPLIETLKSPAGIYWGTRHRAALGITDVSDAACIVVSEETGSISLIEGGKIHRNLGEETLERKLLEIFQMQQPQEEGSGGFNLWSFLPLRKSPAPVQTSAGSGQLVEIRVNPFLALSRRLSDSFLFNLRFIAILIAIIWGLAIGMGTDHNPPTPTLDLEAHTREVLLPIGIQGNIQKYQVQTTPLQATVVLTGKNADLKNLAPEAVKIYVEVKDPSKAEQILPLSVFLPPDIQFKDLRPRTVSLKLTPAKPLLSPAPKAQGR